MKRLCVVSIAIVVDLHMFKCVFVLGQKRRHRGSSQEGMRRRSNNAGQSVPAVAANSGPNVVVNVRSGDNHHPNDGKHAVGNAWAAPASSGSQANAAGSASKAKNAAAKRDKNETAGFTAAMPGADLLVSGQYLHRVS